MDSIKFENGSSIKLFKEKSGKYIDSSVIASSRNIVHIATELIIKEMKPVKRCYVYSYQKYNGKWDKFLLKNSDRLIHSVASSKSEAVSFKNKKAARIWLKNLKKKWNEHLKEKFAKGNMRIYQKYKKGWYKSTKYKIVEEVIHYDFQRFN